MSAYRFKNLVVCSLMLTCAVASHAAQVQNVRGVLLSETLPGSGGLPTIAVDGHDRPHVMADRGPSRASVNIFDRIGTAAPWVNATFDAAATSYRSSQFWNPHLEIVNGIAYCSGIVFGNSIGMGTVVRSGMDTTSPSDPVRGYSVRRIQGAWDAGEGSADPGNGDYLLTSGAGIYKAYGYNPAESYGYLSWRYEGQMYAGAGGEKNAFWISKAAPVRHRSTGTHAVWHGAIGGYNRWDSSYQNSVRHENGLPTVPWAAYSRYKIMEDDGTYVDVKSDAKEPERAYVTSGFVNGQGGVVVNIYDPGTGRMIFPPEACLTVDAIGWSGLRRFAPQLAPAKDGGCWISWSSREGVYVRYISPTGKMGNEFRVGNGERANICTDSEGYLHVVYSNGNLQYCKLNVSGAAGSVLAPADFDGDGKHDLAVFEPDGWWTVRFSSTATKDAIKWGVNGDIPVPANFYNVDARDEFAVWRPSNGTWYINTPTGTARIVWGALGQTPVPADYDGDGRADAATFSNGTWRVKYSGGGNNTIPYGLEGDIPFAWSLPGDGDGKADFIVYRPSDQYWRVLYSKAGAGEMAPVKWGASGDLPYPGDYDGDNIMDFGIYRPSDSRWRAKLSGGGELDDTWGNSGDIAAPGNYYEETADGLWNVTVYRSAARRFYVKHSSDKYLGEPPVQWGGRDRVPVPGNYMNAAVVDIVFFDKASGWWQTSKRDGTWDSDKFGVAGDQPVPEDYNGDGRMDRAVFRPSTGWWYIQTAAAVRKEKWGIPADQPLPADYDGDGILDLAVFRPSTGYWYIDGSKGTPIRQKWGMPGDTPVPADYDNDGELDLAVYRPSDGYWYIQGTKGANLREKWGVPPLDKPVPADYDNDNIVDLAVYRESTGEWLYRSTANANAMRRVTWGGNGATTDIPIRTDIDGDGILDLTIYEGGSWWIRRSGSANTAMPDPRMGVFFGATGTPLGSRKN